MQKLWLITLSILLNSSSFSQDRHPVYLKRGDFSFGTALERQVSRSSADTVRVLAIMVQFKQDSDPRTTGDGRFQMSSGNQMMIDPAPHNAAYFSHKLSFLENYYRKVSNGQLIIKADLFPSLLTLADSMSVYSPKRDGSNEPIARLAIDSWTAASKEISTFPFAKYEAFIIFHAGVGRDVDLVGMLGYDPTPNDIPSIFMNLSSMRTYLGSPTFQGVLVGTGTFRITNSLILPATESRILNLGSRTDTLQLSSNGMLAASFGSFLGLPDLFDTKTGRSGIGQFGLMDGAAIFAYNGLFPPEPSAWEKIYLGWVEPITISRNSTSLSLPAVGLISVGQDTIYKIPINSREYFLVENRQRDPHGNGQRLTVYQNGSIVPRFFGKDTTGFSFDNVKGVGGTIIDVEDFDWALPGSTTQNGFEGGGILIWHIDESIIAEKLSLNAVNADPKRRGVRLVEADGSQDIGQRYEFLQAGSGTENGWPLDFWFEGNVSPVYKNVFDENSFPNTNANNGRQSFVSMKNFSTKKGRMTLSVDFRTSALRVIDSFQRVLDEAGDILSPTVSSSGIFIGAKNKIYALNVDGSSKTKDPSGHFSDNGGQFGVAVFEQGAGTTLLAGVSDRTLYIWRARDITSNGVYDSVTVTSVTLPERITTSPSIYRRAQSIAVLVGTAAGNVYIVNLDGTMNTIPSASGKEVHSIIQMPSSSPTKLFDLFFSSGGTIYGESASVSLPDSTYPWILTGTTTPKGKRILAAQQGGGKIISMDQTLTERFFDIEIENQKIRSVAAADLNGDGHKEFVVLTEHDVFVVNQSGVFLDGFPVSLNATGKLSGAPLIGDIDGDGKLDVALATDMGELFAFTRDGKRLPGFPVQATERSAQELAFFRTTGGKVGLLSVSISGVLKAFETNAAYSKALLPWSQFLQSEWRWNLDTTVTSNPSALSSEFFPRSRVYNWPNPVYGKSTQIRYFVTEDADIDVQIFDLAGTKITSFSRKARGGLDGEITWELVDIQSGVYLARVEARSPTLSEVAVIKIAVVK